MEGAITAIVVSAILFGGFVIIWILSIVFCVCRDSSDEKLNSNRRFTPEEERMIRQNSERRAQKYKDGTVDL